MMNDTGIKQKKNRVADAFHNFSNFMKTSNKKVKSSMCLMGLGQLLYKQWVKGLIYMLIFFGAVAYFALRGVKDLIGFFSLGIVRSNAWLGQKGDDSVVMLIMGIFAWIVVGLLVALYISNVKDVHRTSIRVANGKSPLRFREEAAQLLDKNFYMTVLLLPIVGVCIFNVLPIVFMVLIAFTNYGGDIVPPELVSWIGFGNFAKLVTLSQYGPTFIKILIWNVVWAVSSTFINYFAGIGLALLLNKKCVKGKAIWRAFPILAYAIPGFITLLGFKFMFSFGGPINKMIEWAGSKPYGFLSMDAKWSSRIIGLFANAWISVPTSMLLATGILSNMNADLYEAAKIDGASRWRQFIKITMPFVLFSTTPVLISQFIGNFNNFGIFYFLRDGVTEMPGYFLANDTDLLINWLYKLSIDNNYYAIGAAISLVIFFFTSIISLVIFVKSSSYKKEDTFR